MIVVHKTEVQIDQRAQGVKLPLGAIPLSIGLQHNKIMLWFSRDPEITEEFELNLLLLTSGSPFPSLDHMKHLGRLDIDDATFILHVFYDERSLR